MNIKEELLHDFSINTPRVTVTQRMGILDGVKKIMSFSDRCVIASFGNWHGVLNGDALFIKELSEERLIVMGAIKSVEFHSNKKLGMEEPVNGKKDK